MDREMYLAFMWLRKFYYGAPLPPVSHIGPYFLRQLYKDSRLIIEGKSVGSVIVRV
jgi:hypothetical protein